MHNIMTLREEDLMNTLEYRTMYLCIQDRIPLGIHIHQLAKDFEQIIEIQYMRPIEGIDYRDSYVVALTIDELMIGLRDMFDMLDDDRGTYLAAVIRKIQDTQDINSLDEQMRAFGL